MRLRGFEPPRALAHGHLKAACLPFHHSRAAPKPSACSSLQTDVFLHQCDARPPVDPYVPRICAVLDADPVARVHEQFTDLH